MPAAFLSDAQQESDSVKKKSASSLVSLGSTLTGYLRHIIAGGRG